MAYVERKLLLRNGPPWGFRLYEDMMHGLMVSTTVGMVLDFNQTISVECPKIACQIPVVDRRRPVSHRRLVQATATPLPPGRSQQIRPRSPAESAGMQERDQVLAINGYDSTDMSHKQAVKIIDFAAKTLEIIVGRYERMQQRMETIYLDNTALRARQIPQELTTTELQLFWDKGTPLKPVRMHLPPPPPAPASERTVYMIPSARRDHLDSLAPQQQTFVWKSSPIQILPVQKPQPPPAAPVTVIPRVPSPPPPAPREKLIRPNDPDVTSVSIDQLMRQFNTPLIAPELKKKTYADSSFYSDPTKYYPTIEEQIEMARRVADSLQDPDNMFSRGVNIFEKQRQHADKYVREGPEPGHDPIAEATPEELEHMIPPSPPPPPPPPPPSFPGLQPVNKPAAMIPPPPPLLPGQPKTVQEFLEKIKVFPTSGHNNIDPQKCFDITTALHKSDSRGAKMFAKRFARAKKWDSEDENQETEVLKPMPMVAAPPPQNVGYKHKLMSKLETAAPPPPPPHSQAAITLSALPDSTRVTPLAQQNAPQQPRISLVDDRDSSRSTSKGEFCDAMPKPYGQALLPSYGAGETQRPFTHAENETKPSDNSGWRPVKFNVPAKR